MYINTLALRKAVIEPAKDTISLAAGAAGSAGNIAGVRNFPRLCRRNLSWTGIKEGDLFDSLLIFENYPGELKLVAEGNWSLQVENVEVNEQTNYPLTVIIGSSDELSIGFNYNADLLEEAYVTNIKEQFEQVLLQITNGSANTLKDISILTPAHRKNSCYTNSTAPITAYPQDASLVDLVESRAAKTPDGTAVVFEKQELSYWGTKRKIKSASAEVHSKKQGYRQRHSCLSA